MGVVPTANPHVPVPVQSPLQPLNDEPADADCVSVTAVPCANVVLQVPGQLIPAGVLVTVPEPDVVTDTVTCGAVANVAVTRGADAPIVKLHVPVPVQSPLHPVNTEPAAGVAVKATAVPETMGALVHVPEVTPAVEVQLIEPVPVTVPVPVPAPATEIGKVVGVKLALTEFAVLMVTVHAPVPEQAPPQPENAEPAAGVGVKVTEVPLGKSKEQTAPQLIPAGALTTEPLPVPEIVTFKVLGGGGTGLNVATTL